MEIKLASATQSEDNAIRDRVIACMETGNSGRARTLLTEVKAVNEVLYDSIRMDILQEYGMAV